MATDPLLSRDEVARLVGWSKADTVSRYLAETTRKQRAKEPLTSQDFPLPDQTFGRAPVWHESTILAWQRNRPGHGGGSWSRRRSQPRRAVHIEREDVIQWEGRHLRVLDREPGDECVRLCVTASQRDAAEWVQIPRQTWVPTVRRNTQQNV